MLTYIGFVSIIVISFTVLATAVEIDGFDMTDGVFNIGEPDWKLFQKTKRVNLVMFTVPWCKHCKDFGPSFDLLADRLSRTMPDVAVARVNTDKWKKVGEWANVKRVPTIALFINDKMTKYPEDAERELELLYKWMTELIVEKLGDDITVLPDTGPTTDCPCCAMSIAFGAALLAILYFLCCRSSEKGERVESKEGTYTSDEYDEYSTEEDENSNERSKDK